jgi:demethylmenaquinone methyltransferase/2-methoxy-6-polyprenyl-1,4-benzoquinol methylase
VKQITLEEFAVSLQFAFASMLTGLVSVLAFAAVFARGYPKHAPSKKPSNAFLADKQRALYFYNVFSAAYDLLNPYLYTDRMRSEIVNQIGGGNSLRVLDVGCGTGYTTRGILHLLNVGEVVAVDMNPYQLAKAAKNMRLYKRKTFFSMGDVENLPFRDGSFDAVASVGAIEYFPNPQLALKEIARVTKLNGKVVVCGPEAAWFGKLGLDRVFYTPSANEVEALFYGSGLTQIASVLAGVKTFFGTSSYVVVVTGMKGSIS